MIVRPLTKSDAQDWLALRIEGVKLFPDGFLPSLAEAQKLTLDHAETMLSYGAFIGVFDKSTLIGFAAMRRETFENTKHRAALGPFYVTPDHQGSPAATLLMETLLKTATETGIEQLELFVESQNHRAIRFYEKHGFKHIATHPNSVKIDGVAHDDCFYCRHIGPSA